MPLPTIRAENQKGGGMGHASRKPTTSPGKKRVQRACTRIIRKKKKMDGGKKSGPSNTAGKRGGEGGKWECRKRAVTIE